MIQNNNTKPATGIIRSLLAISAASSCLYAQTPAQLPEAELTPITVSAHGLAVPYDNTGVSVSVLDIPQLKEEGITTLSEALTTVPGTFVLPGGGLNQRGNVSNIAIRGMSNATATLPMLDGMRLYNSTNVGNIVPNVLGQTNLFSLGTVEVLRGTEGAVYGSGAMGGVIFMETPEGKGKPSYSTFQEAGSFDTYTGNVTAQGQVNKLSYFLSATYEHTNNDIRYADGHVHPVKHTGRYTQWSEALRLDYAYNKRNKLTFTYRREDADYTYPSKDWESGAYGTDPYKFRNNLVTAKWTSRLTDKWTSSLMAGYYGRNQKCGSEFGQDYWYTLRNIQIEWRNAYRWNEQNTTTFGFVWNRSDARTANSGQEDGKDLSGNDLENIYGIFAEHRLSPRKGWDNTLALRLDQSNIYDSLPTVRAATSYKFNRERTRVFASVGTGYRAPGSLERSQTTYTNGWGYKYIGNPDLKTENSYSADLGLEQHLGDNHRASMTFFWTRREDAIYSFFDMTDYAYHYANSTGHWLSQGIEFALRGTWEKHWNTGYSLAYTLTQPKTNNDAQIPQSSRQLWSADIHTSPLDNLTTGIGLTAAVRRSDWAGATMDNYCVLRWYARYKVNEHLSLHLRVENLTNQKFATDSVAADSMINSGIGIFGGCTLSF